MALTQNAGGFPCQNCCKQQQDAAEAGHQVALSAEIVDNDIDQRATGYEKHRNHRNQYEQRPLMKRMKIPDSDAEQRDRSQ